MACSQTNQKKNKQTNNGFRQSLRKHLTSSSKIEKQLERILAGLFFATYFLLFAIEFKWIRCIYFTRMKSHFVPCSYVSSNLIEINILRAKTNMKCVFCCPNPTRRHYRLQYSRQMLKFHRQCLFCLLLPVVCTYNLKFIVVALICRCSTGTRCRFFFSER